MTTLDAVATAALLDYDALVEAIAVAAVELSRGEIRCPERLVVPLAGDATLLSMPAVAADVAIHKLITVSPANAASGLPTIQGRVSVFDPVTGVESMNLDGPTVTGRRTAAVSMLAMRLLLPAPPRTVLLIGTGIQAGHHVDALAALHRGIAVRVRGSTKESATRFCGAHAERFDDLGVAPDFRKGEWLPDVVLTCTTSPTPVYGEPATANTLVIATGSFRPTIAEIARATVLASAICVDDPQGARVEAGDLLVAGIDWNVVGSLADLVGGVARPTGPVLFKSVGCAAWDLAAARTAQRAAFSPSAPRSAA